MRKPGAERVRELHSSPPAQSADGTIPDPAETAKSDPEQVSLRQSTRTVSQRSERRALYIVGPERVQGAQLGGYQITLANVFVGS